MKEIIAEIGSSHDGSFGNAEKLILAAKDCKADIIKFQLHLPEYEMLPTDPSPSFFKSENRFDYTAIGDAVNVAARLESGTKAAGVDLLIGQSTENAVEFDLIPLDPIEAKGKSEKLQVYTWDSSYQ